MRDIRQLSVVESGLLGSSILLASLRSFTRINVTDYSYRYYTRNKIRQLAVSTAIVDVDTY